MRFVYFLVSSSLLIGMVLVIRWLFRRKLAPGTIYALWLIPLIRLLIPFGTWEFPVFGTVADISYGIVSELHEWQELSNSRAAGENVVENVPIQQSQNELISGTKIYDAVEAPQSERADVFKDSLTPIPAVEEASEENFHEQILISIWLVGAVSLGIYVFVQNRKLNRSLGEMRVTGKVEGLEILVSSEAKVPCLVGMRNPQIVMTEENFYDSTIYECILQHELAHFHQKDHIWNAVKIIVCVIYWWNPLVWFAAKCMEEDAELACDSKVLKNQTIEVRKSYGYALLKMLENAENRNSHFYAVTSMSGSKKSIKRRIQEISSSTITKKQVILPILMLMISILVLGCAVPTNKSWIKTTEWQMEETEDKICSKTEFRYAVQENIESMLFYYEVYDYGELKVRSILAFDGVGDVMKSRDTVKFRRESSKAGQEEALIMSHGSGRAEFELPIVMYHETSESHTHANAGGALNSEDGKIEIIPETSYILLADYRAGAEEKIQTFNCEQLSFFTEEELGEILKENWSVMLVRVVFSELPMEELYQKFANAEIAEDEMPSEAMATAWANAFVERDASTIEALASEEGIQKLIENGLVGEYEEGEYYFGWSSPWPMFGNQLYEITECNDAGAKIRYYASFSTPHVYVWDETLEFENVDGRFQVVNESNHFYDVMHTAEEFYQAYPEGAVTGTMMDYYTNGLGEILNKNALLSSSTAYQPLFDAGTAALELLNISKDEELVYYSVEDSGGMATVQIYFLEEGGRNDMVEVTMWQPYGEEGIWIPQ